MRKTLLLVLAVCACATAPKAADHKFAAQLRFADESEGSEVHFWVCTPDVKEPAPDKLECVNLTTFEQWKLEEIQKRAAQQSRDQEL